MNSTQALLSALGLPYLIASSFLAILILLCLLSYARLLPSTLDNGLRFCWNCFLKPHTGDRGRNQQDALESFYKAQASVYDATRTRLLRGREDMLGLVAAQVKQRVESKLLPARPVWVDVGGGTGYNIEQMAKFVDVPSFFSAVYLVDLSPSLCSVAQDRFARLGWKNVKVLCQDARSFSLENTSDNEKQSKDQRADVITMSYSLSMIPEYYSVLDALSSRLTENGIFGVADFYVQSEVDYQSRNYIGGEINRHCMWISRVFWRTWFEVDRVSLEAARRDYLEYRFGTILSFNARCHLVGFRIPFYVWVGCSKDSAASTTKLAQLNAAATNSPFIAALDDQQKQVAEANAEALSMRSKAYESAVVNLSASLPLPSTWYQAHHWRIYYDNALQKHRQFKDEYIYAFTWEDARVDSRILKLNEDDVVLAITSAGDNILAYALDSPKRIHAVDLNPAQNHLLELKMAAFAALPHEDVWQLFGEGKHPDFRHLLVTRLSPHLSSLAFQYWLEHGPSIFRPLGKGLYYTGGSRHALNLVGWLFRILTLTDEVRRLCETQTLAEQREIWHRSLRRVLLSRMLSWCVISNKQWLWKALGVPNAQREMIEKDYAATEASGQSMTPPLSPTLSPPSSPILTSKTRDPLSRAQSFSSAIAAQRPVPDNSIQTYGSGRAIWSYAVNTLDPVINHTLLSSQNHYYLLTLLGRYTRQCHPEYLTPQAHRKLSRPNAFNGLRIHTDEVADVIERMQPSSLTVAVVMDSMDWFEESDAKASAEVRRQVRLLRRALKIGGRVLLRSAGTAPWYLRVFESEGFRPRRINVRTRDACVDRVNMYASTWICTKQVEEEKQTLGDLSIGEGALE